MTNNSIEARRHDRLLWDPEVQLMPREQLRELQNQRLREVIRRVFERPVPFFLDKLRSGGVESPEDIQTVDDLNSVPLTVKNELRASEAEYPPIGNYRFFDLRDAVRLSESGGTTGTPTLNLWTARDVEVEHETGARRLWREGFRPGMIISHSHPAYLYGGGLMMQTLYEYMGVLSIWVPPPVTDEAAEQGIRMWQRVPLDRPFRGPAARRFAEVAVKMGLDPVRDLNLVNTGMGGRFVTKGEIGVYPLISAGSEALAYLGGRCGESTGAHIAEDYAFVQAIDPATGKEVADGEWGNHVITTFGKDGSLIRYDMDELCRIDTSPCPCGETSARAWWGGRTQDIISTQGRQIWAFDLDTALSNIDELRFPSLEFVAVRPRESDAPLLLRVEYDQADQEVIRQRIEPLVMELLEIRVTVEFVPRGTLPRFAHKRSIIANA
jgi:phenylacetate-CoA ligase